ncbi:SRPBCC family protein [Streptomyces avidinii]|uniref:SRPBCC family protein n=1 Tax=Streptomyces avidinii TaxID=1895 RepID=UPI0037B4BC22
MPSQRVRTSEHTARIAAPAGVVYGLIADAVRWPLLLPTPVHVERIDFDGLHERLRLWDLDGEQVRSFHLHRILHPGTRTVEFEQEDTARPGLPTTGTWTVEAHGDTHCLVTLRQDRTPERHPAADTAHTRRPWQSEPADRLTHLSAVAERWEHLDQLLLSFEDSLHLEGPAELVYDFLHRIEDWPERLPHVDAADVNEDVPGIQIAALDTCAPDGRTRATRTARLCFPSAARIVFKELRTPHPIAARTGAWSLTPDGDGVRVVCAQQVLLHDPRDPRDRRTPQAPHDPHTPQAPYDPQGPGAPGGLAETRREVRTWLGRASTETLRLAGWRARTAVRRLR